MTCIIVASPKQEAATFSICRGIYIEAESQNNDTWPVFRNDCLVVCFSYTVLIIANCKYLVPPKCHIQQYPTFLTPV